MASHAQAYRNSGDLKSVNFAPPPPSPLVRRIDASRLPPRYRVTLKHFVIESQHGPDLWASTFRASKAADVSYKTMQRHLDWLEREKILHKKHSANEFISGKGLRRPATYVLNGTSAKWLAPRETYPQWQRKNRRQAPSRKRPASITRSVHSTAAPVPEVAKPSPSPTVEQIPILDARRGITTSPALDASRKLTRDEKFAFAKIYLRNRKIMPHPEALQDACEQMHTSFEIGSLVLKIAESKGALDGLPCEKHPDSGRTQWGTCWGCYSEECSAKTECECALHPGSRRTPKGECWECYVGRYPSGCAPG